VLEREDTRSAPGKLRFRHGKEMHVSPFMPMEQSYEWRLSVPGPTLAVHTRVLESDRQVLDATLSLRRQEIDGRSLAERLVPLVDVWGSEGASVVGRSPEEL